MSLSSILVRATPATILGVTPTGVHTPYEGTRLSLLELILLELILLGLILLGLILLGLMKVR
jgi:hypothetical protein